MSVALSRVFQEPVTSLDVVRDVIGAPSELALRKELSSLDAHCRAFIAQSPFVLVGTAGASGRCDVSPRGDAPGFVLVLDEKTLVIPDRPGNRRVDSFQNIIENPHVGLLFIVPGVEETLRLNGRALLVRDPDLLERMSAQGKIPTLGIAVEVEEVFLHCAKAFRRSHLWQSDTWPERSALPSLGKILLDQLKPADTSAADLDCALEDAYAKTLY
ncbi:MAG: pyridoxamine 5'-phosphate oxidase family protein [Thermomicrobiales bacterium]